MLDFLKTVSDNSDLGPLWRAFLSADYGDAQRNAMLVFSDCLEEIGGWEFEANFLRKAAHGGINDIPVRLRMPGARFSPISYAPARESVNRAVLSYDAFAAMGIRNYAQPEVRPSTWIMNVHCDLYGLPRKLFFYLEELPYVLEWLSLFLHQLPVTAIYITIRSRRPLRIFRYTLEHTLERTRISTPKRFLTMELPARANFKPDNPLAISTASFRLFEASDNENLFSDSGADENDAPDMVTRLSAESFELRKILFWLSCALRIPVAVSIESETIAEHFPTEHFPRGDYHILVTEALRFRKYYALIGR